MKLHIGCGTKNLPGWKHYDIRRVDDHIDYIGSADDLSIFPDNSIEEIYACHLLEHFGRHKVDSVLGEWNRVLVPDGEIHIAVPDFEAIVKVYNNGFKLCAIMGLLYGGQDYKNNYHYCTFDYALLSEKLRNAGFVRIERYDWQTFLPDGYDDFSRAYLPHMDFAHGTLMSLNVKARKEKKGGRTIGQGR